MPDFYQDEVDTLNTVADKVQELVADEDGMVEAEPDSAEAAATARANVGKRITALLAQPEVSDEDLAEVERLEAKERRFEAIQVANRRRERARQSAGRITTREHASELQNRDDDEPIRFKIPATARRYASRCFSRESVDGFDGDHRAYRFGMWALSTIHRSLPGYSHLAGATEWCEKHLATSHGTNITGGGYLIPIEFSRDMIELREQFGVARKLLRIVPMASDTLVIPRRTGGLTAYFVSENAAGTSSSKTWDAVQLVAKTITAICRTSNQLMADAAISIADDLAREIAIAFAEKEDQCAFNGDGTSTYGGAIGFRSKLTSIDGAGTNAAGLVTGTGTTWSSLVLSDFHAVIGKLPQYADTPGASWVCHKTFYETVMKKLAFAAGGVTATEIIGGVRQQTFLGYPVMVSQVFPSTTSTSTVVCTFGDHSLAATFGERSMESIAFSEHATVDGESVFVHNQIAVRGTQRFDIVVHDVGTSAVVGPVVGLETGA